MTENTTVPYIYAVGFKANAADANETITGFSLSLRSSWEPKAP